MTFSLYDNGRFQIRNYIYVLSDQNSREKQNLKRPAPNNFASASQSSTGFKFQIEFAKLSAAWQ